jgi:predicted ArsR family transcriptional regulator
MELQPIPEDLRRFVLTSIPSVPYLEALLLLRAQAQDNWSSAALAERLYVREKAAQALLEDLCKAGVAEACDQLGAPAYRYQPASANLRAMIDRLAELYARQLVEVTILIHSKLDRKAHQFADAFKWRKDS